jgi:hypothetical protein
LGPCLYLPRDSSGHGGRGGLFSWTNYLIHAR